MRFRSWIKSRRMLHDFSVASLICFLRSRTIATPALALSMGGMPRVACCASGPDGFPCSYPAAAFHCDSKSAVCGQRYKEAVTPSVMYRIDRPGKYSQIAFSLCKTGIYASQRTVSPVRVGSGSRRREACSERCVAAPRDDNASVIASAAKQSMSFVRMRWIASALRASQ